MACKIKDAKKRYDKAIDDTFAKVGDKLNKYDPYNILTTTKVQKDFSRVISEYQAAMADVYENAAKVHEYLKNDLLEEESVSIVQALNGDLEPTSLDAHLKPLYEKIRAKIDNNADLLVKAGALKEKSKINDYLKRYYAKHLEDKVGIAKLIHGQKFKKRKDLSHGQRIALGMLEDASIVVSKTLAEQRTQLLKASTLKTIANKFALDEAKDGYIKVSDETNGGGIKKYGALAGKYIPQQLAYDFKHAELAKETFGLLEKYWMPIIDHIKVNVTVKNPVTHLYNIGSNLMLATLNGDLTSLAKVMHMKSSKPNEFKALIKKANKYGLNSSLKDFEDMNAVLDKGKFSLAKSLVKNLYLAKGSKVGDSIRNLYDWEDKIFKLATFKKLLDEGMSESSAYEGTSVYVDYSTPLPAFVRTMDKTGLFPFVHYVYKSTPATAKVILKNPMKFMLLQAALIGTGASAWLSSNDEDYRPDWAADQLNLFGAKEWVRVSDGWYLNLGRMLPAMKFGGLDFSLDTGFGFVGGIVNIANGKTPLGYDISKKYDESYVKAGRKLLTMAENYLPPITFGRYGQRFSKKALGIEQKNYYDEDMTYTELGSRGVGVRHFNEEKELKTKLKKAKNKKNYKNKVNPADKKDHEKDYNTTARRLTKSGNKLGVNLRAKKSTFNLPKFDL